MELSDPIISINGLGPKAQEKLNACGIYNLEHLLFHLPYRYQNKTSFGQLNQARIPVKCFVLWRLIDIQGDTFPNHLCRFLSHQNIG
jgi:ATP-dependent DNA helicase RecG